MGRENGLGLITWGGGVTWRKTPQGSAFQDSQGGTWTACEMEMCVDH